MTQSAETGQKPFAGVEIPIGFGKLPQSVQEGIGDVVVIYKEKDTRYKTIDEINGLIPDIDFLVSAHFAALKPFKYDMPWRDVWKESLRESAESKARGVKRGNEWYLHQDSMMYAPFGTYESDIATAAGKWATVGDQEGFENNPSVPLLRLFKLANLYRSWAMVKVEGAEWREMLVLRTPLRSGEERRFGGRSMEIVLPYTEQGPVCDEAKYVVEFQKPLHRVELLTPPIQMNQLL